MPDHKQLVVSREEKACCYLNINNIQQQLAPRNGAGSPPDLLSGSARRLEALEGLERLETS